MRYRDIDSAGLWTGPCFQGKERAAFQLLDYLKANATVEIEIEVMLIVRHRMGDSITGWLSRNEQSFGGRAMDFATVCAGGLELRFRAAASPPSMRPGKRNCQGRSEAEPPRER